jgi:hypothetical protein
LSGAAGTLASLLARATPGLQFNEHMDEADGALVFAHYYRLDRASVDRRIPPS